VSKIRLPIFTNSDELGFINATGMKLVCMCVCMCVCMYVY